MELKGLKINFLGDSITQGVGASVVDNAYPNVLKREAQLSEARNYGISGTRIALQQPTAERAWNEVVDTNSFCERFYQMDDDADVVVVFGGTNDYGHGSAPIGSFSDRTADTFYGACHCLFSGLIKKYLGKTVIIMTPLHRCNEMVAAKLPARGPHYNLKGYVDIIREVAEYYSLLVLDLFKESGLQPAVPEIQEKYMPDGLHPSDDGHRVVAEKLKTFLEKL